MDKKFIAIAGVLVAAATTPAFCDTWIFRAGLWEMTIIQDAVAFPPIPPGLPAEQQARLKALRDKIPPPKPYTTQFCQSAGTSSPMESIFDPANQPPGACSEKVLSESKADREVEDDCELLSKMKTPGTGQLTLPPTPTQTRRHILLAGDGAGTIDQADVTGGLPGNSLTRQFHWLGANCGRISPTSN